MLMKTVRGKKQGGDFTLVKVFLSDDCLAGVTLSIESRC